MVRRNCASHQLGHRKDCDDSDKSQCSDVDPYSTSCNLGSLPTYPSNQCSSSSSLSINCSMAEINTRFVSVRLAPIDWSVSTVSAIAPSRCKVAVSRNVSSLDLRMSSHAVTRFSAYWGWSGRQGPVRSGAVRLSPLTALVVDDFAQTGVFSTDAFCFLSGAIGCNHQPCYVDRRRTS
jgi:hypothetical protein